VDIVYLEVIVGGVVERSTIQLIQLRGGSGVAQDCGMGRVANVLLWLYRNQAGDGERRSSNRVGMVCKHHYWIMAIHGPCANEDTAHSNILHIFSSPCSLIFTRPRLA
jgi:hypothetical protein